MAYIGDQFRGIKPAWVNGTGLWGNLYTEEQEARSAYHLIQTLVGSYAAGMVGLTYTGISDAILLPSPVSLIENRLDPDPPRAWHEAAGAFSMMARIFPEVRGHSSWRWRSSRTRPTTTWCCTPFTCHGRILRPRDTRPSAGVSTRCPNRTTPSPSTTRTVRKRLTSARYLDLPQGTDLAVYRYTGELATGGCTQDPFITFDEAPILIAWGDDTDGDCIPDVSDNCPVGFNPNRLRHRRPRRGGRRIDGGTGWPGKRLPG